MIIEQNMNPVFEAPEGYDIVDAIKLDADLLDRNRLVVRAIEILDDYAIEITFASYKELIGEFIDERLEGLDDNEIADVDRSKMCEDICTELGDSYFDNLAEIGIPRSAIVAGPDEHSNRLGTDFSYTAWFLIQPKLSFELRAFLSGLTQVTESKQVIISKSALLLSSDEDYDRYRINERYHLHKLGLDLAWALPWHMHWTIDYARTKHEEQSDEDPKLIFSYDFFCQKRSWHGYSDMNRSFPIPIFDYFLRPIIHDTMMNP